MTLSENPCIVILGATGGVGSALARNLSKRGSRLNLIGRDHQKLAQLADELNAQSQVIDGVTVLLAKKAA